MEVLLAFLLQARNVSHVLHWKVKSLSLHLALGELYELLSEFADELAEMEIGAHGDLKDVNHDVSLNFNKSDPSEFMNQICTSLEYMKSGIPQDGFIINKFEELQAAAFKVKYKIENLK